MKRKERRELSFRKAMPVTEVLLFSSGKDAWPRCPRCRLTMDREYVCFCDRCGQKLDWSNFQRAVEISVI